MESRVYATFIKRNDGIYRTDTYMQFGESDAIIGACVLCNPGSSSLNAQMLQAKLEEDLECEFVRHEVTRDDTMKQLEQILTKMYQETLQGRFIIYNLFTLRNANMQHATQILSCENNDEELMFKDFNDFKADVNSIPWILIGWGCESSKKLNSIKNQWLTNIHQMNVPYIGIQGKAQPHYYHPLPKIYNKRIEYVNDIVEQYKTLMPNKRMKSKFVKFPVEATQRNILIEPCERKLEFNGDRWAIENGGPEYIVKGYSNVFLKEAYKLVACHYRDSLGGRAFVWAIPKKSEVSLPKSFNKLEQTLLSPPKPEEALESFMMAIDGDRSPLSYLQAAMLVHELGEYGADWHGVNWGEDIMLPISSNHRIAKDSYEWTMLQKEPEIIHPHFYYDEDKNPVVIFHTINDIVEVTLNQYKHIFSKEDYSMKVERTIIATAGIGCIF